MGKSGVLASLITGYVFCGYFMIPRIDGLLS